MQIVYLLTVAFTAVASATQFQHFHDAQCQTATGEYVLVTKGDLEKIAASSYAGAQTITEASRSLTSSADKMNCPSNSDDTYKWIKVPQWARTDGRGGGYISVVYYKETDTYNLCHPLAAAQANGYAGSCK